MTRRTTALVLFAATVALVQFAAAQVDPATAFKLGDKNKDGALDREEIKKLAEDAKVACRNVRRDGNKAFETAEKDKKITEDELTKGKDKVQDLLKNYEARI